MLVIQPKIAFCKLLFLHQNQSLKLPEKIHEVQILSGSAWLTFSGKDIILRIQEVIAIPKTKHGAVISGISQEPLVFEIR
jgi:hypothetical protein